ncbi:MAG TPA: response regulator transcription factor [Kofleriaceae bacterium]|jgi:DNA-binding response OmpR family regulator
MLTEVTVLVVEDQERLASTLVKGLIEEGFSAIAVHTAADALLHVTDIGLRAIVLDLGLPDRDGQSVITELRRKSGVPILVLTARDAIDQRVKALDSGADDYLVKPFAFEELLARLRATLRRAEPIARKLLSVGGIELVTGEPSVTLDGRAVQLSPREKGLVELLVSRLNEVVSRRDILKSAFGYEFDPGTNIVEVHIGHVRRKLAGSRLQIETVRGFGYRARELPAGATVPG